MTDDGDIAVEVCYGKELSRQSSASLAEFCKRLIVFPDQETFEKVRRTGVINPKLFSRLNNVQESAIEFTEYGPGYAFKATIPRLVGSGDVEDTDLYGAQQHAPLLDVEIPI